MNVCMHACMEWALATNFAFAASMGEGVVLLFLGSAGSSCSTTCFVTAGGGGGGHQGLGRTFGLGGGAGGTRTLRLGGGSLGSGGRCVLSGVV